jgi:hypothetical protein
MNKEAFMMIDETHELQVAARALEIHSQKLFGATAPKRVLTAHLAKVYAEVVLNAALNARKPQFEPLNFRRVEAAAPTTKLEA